MGLLRPIGAKKWAGNGPHCPIASAMGMAELPHPTNPPVLKEIFRTTLLNIIYPKGFEMRRAHELTNGLQFGN